MPPAPQRSPARAPARRSAARADGERSRARILDAAEALFARHGYSGAGIAAISRESGLPPSSIYWFFASKEELAGAVIERASGRWLDAIGSGEGLPAEQRFSHLFARGLELSGRRIPDFIRLSILMFLERRPSDRRTTAHVRRARERALALLRSVVAAMLEERLGRRAGPLAGQLAALLMSFVDGALILRELDPDAIDLAELPEDLRVALVAIARRRLEAHS
jgi:AcrR family transcriptional regulator